MKLLVTLFATFFAFSVYADNHEPKAAEAAKPAAKAEAKKEEKKADAKPAK